jgi:hypothetical protein
MVVVPSTPGSVFFFWPAFCARIVLASTELGWGHVLRYRSLNSDDEVGNNSNHYPSYTKPTYLPR